MSLSQDDINKLIRLGASPSDIQNLMAQASYGAGSGGMVYANAPPISIGDIVGFQGEECPVVCRHPNSSSYLGIEFNGGWPRTKPGDGNLIPAEYEAIKEDKYYWVQESSVTRTTKKAQPKKKIFDLTKLEPLIIADEVMDEIKAVLRQQENAKKMFEEWGLGEVIEYGKGMTFLFYGPPGTGKTWAANCIAKVFGVELLTIGAAEIQTSEPGGANRNIQQAFASAKKTKKILFLDECDSLITSRSDVGMILGGEINTLLTEIEKAEDVVILATNRIEHLDEALERRISLIVEFPEPDFEQRKRIWEKMLPSKLPIAKAITPAKLAEYKLTGGQIKNVLLQAARLALSSESTKVETKHIEAAVDRIIKSKSLMGSASRYHQISVRDDFRKGNSQ